MNSDIRTLITDVKAAARIGHAESLWVALDGLLDLPQVSGNPPMDRAFIEKVILPLGEALSNPRLNISVILPLLDEPQAALRACAAAALAYRLLNQDSYSVKQLAKPGKDTRQDVRLALRLALAQAGEDHPEKLAPLTAAWLDAPSPRLQAVAVALLPLQPDRAITALAGLDNPSDPEVRAALVDTFTKLAQTGQAAQVLKLLADWAKNRENNVWVICKTLSGSWAASSAGEALEILPRLLPKADNPKQIINTLQALSRHGANAEVLDTLNAWQGIGDAPLQELASHVLPKLETPD
jgi:hypothetical protein